MNQSAGAAQHGRSYSTDTEHIDPIGPDRNWKGVGISLLVILAILSFIGLSIVLLSTDEGGKGSGSQLTLDDLFQRVFQIHDPEAKWVSDAEIVFRSWDGDILKFDTRRNETVVLLKNSTFETFKASTFAVSPDQNFVLLGYDVKRVYQYSFVASYLIYNLQTREVRELNPPEVSDSVLQFASWGVRGQQLIYVFESNIYYQEEVRSSAWRLTASGREGVVFNGVPDWLYEEEVLHSRTAHWWSPDGSSLAYLTINDSLVPNMLLPRLTGALYPRGGQYPYPKMDQNNPAVRLHVVSTDGAASPTELTPPDRFENSDYYVTMVTWLTQAKLSVRWVNRAQNTSVLSLCDVTAGDCTEKHVMTSEKWLDRQNEPPLSSNDGSTLFITVPLKDGDRGAFRHLIAVGNRTEGRDGVLQLTSGGWEVTQIVSFDDITNSVYFLSTEEDSTQRHLYRVSAAPPSRKVCLTCSLFRARCSFYDATVSPDRRLLLLHCRGPGAPQTTVHRLRDMSQVTTLEGNPVLRDALMSRTRTKRDRRTIRVNGFDLPLELTVPEVLDETKEHPLLLVLDSAPGGQAVNDLFSLGWDSVLVSSDNIIVARLDGRGSGFRGQRVLQEVHQRLGTVDVQDQMAALEQLVGLPYVDGRRVGVYGEAYGGFLSSLLLLSQNSLLRCGVAVAPITNWRLYGSTPAEKYFGYPGREDHKFQVSSLLRNVTMATPQSFRIVHGTADPSVHFQHSAELVKLLLASSVNYTLQIFPDEGHFLSTARTRRFLFSSLLSFFRRCFEQEVDPETAEEDD
ncbi:inactive dipeptidyl peptidase 10-like [Brachionichthys hirsutus]|uniref:inactive dipeptidyl peptidase 10-like n=1 Tax=Brachionichthys hirsutus TaxID=412623 RepID=UPI00360462AB